MILMTLSTKGVTSPVGSRCVCSGLTSRPCFRSQSRKPTQLTAPKWRARSSSWKRSGHNKCFLKKVSFFQGEVSSLSKLGQSRIRSSSRCSGPPGQANSSFLHPWNSTSPGFGKGSSSQLWAAYHARQRVLPTPPLSTCVATPLG